MFPGGVHTRFEHSIGTANLASKVMDVLKTYHSDEIEKGDTENVILASLIYNLGHGPFSFTFSKNLLKRRLGIDDWSFKDASKMLFEYMVDENHIDIELENIDKKLLFEIIDGEGTSERKWLYSIVNNRKSSVDVEKFDYILRDAYNVGVKSIFFDPDRLLRTARIINNEIAFHSRNDSNLYGLFHSRYKLFKEVYLHRT